MLCCERITTNENMDFINRKQSRVMKKMWNEDMQPGGDESCPVLSLLLIVLCSERVLGRRGLLIFPLRVTSIRPKGRTRRRKRKTKKIES